VNGACCDTGAVFWSHARKKKSTIVFGREDAVIVRFFCGRDGDSMACLPI
jgi:hypothetical protein